MGNEAQRGFAATRERWGLHATGGEAALVDCQSLATRLFVGHDGAATCCAVDAGRQWLYTGGRDGAVRQWSTVGEARLIRGYEPFEASACIRALHFAYGSTHT